MEIIRKIKQAETEAKEIIENARQKALKDSESAKKEFADLMAKAEQKRKKSIEDAIAKAQQDAKNEIAQISSETEKYCAALEQKTSIRINSSADKVLDFIKGL